MKCGGATGGTAEERGEGRETTGEGGVERGKEKIKKWNEGRLEKKGEEKRRKEDDKRGEEKQGNEGGD